MRRLRQQLGRLVGRAARPALEAPDSPVQAANARIRALETSVSELWHISERLRGASDRMYVVADEELPEFREEFDGRLMNQDVGRVELMHALESVRRRVELLERRLAAIDGPALNGAANGSTNGAHAETNGNVLALPETNGRRAGA